MTPKERQLLKDLETRVTNLEGVRNVAFLAELQRRLSSGVIAIDTGASTSGTSIAVRNAADDGSETVADNYSGVLTIYKNGVAVGRVGYYT